LDNGVEIPKKELQALLFKEMLHFRPVDGDEHYDDMALA
jgi:hypothetical protein